VALLRAGAWTARLERVAALTVADIKVIPDNRKHHRMRAVQQLTVLDGLEVHVWLDVRGAMTVPTKLVAHFRLEAERAGH
jgi:hypothetical protein